VLLFAVVTAILLVRTRVRAALREASLRDQIDLLKADADRFNALLRSEPQLLVSWPAAGDHAEIIGDATLVTAASSPQRGVAFGSWLDPVNAQAMDHHVAARRSHGESFAMKLVTPSGRTLEADGRAVGGRAVLRLRDVSGLKRDLAELAQRHDRLLAEFESL